MSNINAFKNIPEISFIDNITLEDIRNEMLDDYQEAYRAETGKEPDMNAGTPERLMLYAFANNFYQALKYIDRAGKMGLLKYSEADYLDNLALLKGITRNEATAAKVTLKFTLSDIRTSVTAIPGGTRVAAGDIYFATDEYLEILAGQESGTVTATAITAGTGANGLAVKEIDTLVDPVPYVANVTNIDVSAGGTNKEDDESLTYRIYNAPNAYSVAGPKEAYEYHARRIRSDIDDIVVYSPEPDKVNVVFTINEGEIPDSKVIAEVEEGLSADDIRPLTDIVTAKGPTKSNYDIKLTYYINKSDSNQAVAIQTAVNEAIEEYKKWQQKIGRDINPSKLIQLIIGAGAKRTAITKPLYTAVNDYDIAIAANTEVTYGGLEDD